MNYGYAIQIVTTIITVGAIALAVLRIASARYDERTRKTREGETNGR